MNDNAVWALLIIGITAILLTLTIEYNKTERVYIENGYSQCVHPGVNSTTWCRGTIKYARPN